MFVLSNHKRTTLQTTHMYSPTLALNIHHGTLAAAYGTAIHMTATLLKPKEPVHYNDKRIRYCICKIYLKHVRLYPYIASYV